MGIRHFISEFNKRKGFLIFLATIVSKLSGFLLMVFLLRYFSKEDYGNLKYAHTFVGFLMPFMGLGIFQSFLKYAPIQKFLYLKKYVFKITLVNGFWASLILTALLITISPFVTINMSGSLGYLIGFSFLIVSLFIFESVKDYYRVFYINKAYAILELKHAISILVGGVLFSWLFGLYGYIATLVIVPIILSISFFRKRSILSSPNYVIKEKKSELWQYGLYTSLGGLVSKLIYSIDIISIGNIIKDSESVAHYTALSLIPLNLIFLPITVLKTDFVKLVQESKNRKYLISYIKNFVTIFSLISIALVVLSYFFGNWLVELIFGASYADQSQLFLVFIIGIAGAFILRIPFGNLLVAIGWTKISTIISIIILIADVILNYFWVHKWGIIGAAYTTSLLLWASGILTLAVFIVYLRKLKHETHKSKSI